MKSKKIILNLIALSTIVLGENAFAAGYEKSMSWSGKSVGSAGAVVGSVKGAEALYFNPAGLAHIPGKKAEASLNFSPTFSKFSGPASFSTAGSIDGKSGFSPIFGVMGGYQLNEKLGVGLGVYVSGGAKSKFENVDYSSTFPNVDQTKATIQTNLSVTEIATGAGYEILPGLTFGAAWRALMVKADFSTVSLIQSAAILNVFVNDITKTQYNGYKLGLQYAAPDHSWGLGLNYRSSVFFTAKGKSSGTFEPVTNTLGTARTDLVGGDATFANTFPDQLVVGGYYEVCPKLRTALEYSFTHYAKNSFVDIEGSVVVPSLSVTKQLTDINQSWRNQHLIRLGNEYTLDEKITLRAGYSITTQVTASHNARNTFASPGTGHAITTGAGYTFSENLELNGALEYSFTNGKADNISLAKTLAGTDGTTKEVATESEFKSHAMVVHLGTTYRF